MRRAILILAVLLVSRSAVADGLREVEVTGMRVHLGELVTLTDPTLDVDLGASPAPGGTRLYSRADLERALPDDARLLVALPEAIRVVRKMEQLDAPALERLVRKSFVPPRGVTLSSVQPAPRTAVAAGWTQARVILPKLPKRTGAIHVSAMLELRTNDALVSRVPVDVEVQLGPEAALPDVVHGAVVSLVVRRGAVEISTDAVVLGDADVGEVVTVTARATGRTLRARLTTSRSALALEGP